jgi:myo-inositol-1(or 4)-monophosphatase
MNAPLETLKQIALNAGEIVKEGYYAQKEIDHKGTVDLVTQYDLRSEAYIMEQLEKHFGDYTLIGEESFDPSLGYAHPKAIYIDPIDGTTNFVHGIPYLGISLGVWEASEPILAVVYNPILDELFYAAKGEGAYLNGKKLRVSTQESLQQSLIGTGFPYAKVNRSIEHDWVLKTLGNLLANIRDIRRLGAAAIDLCYVAQGKIEAFYEIDLQPWDVSAGILLVLEAGGKITNAQGRSFALQSKSIVASNGKIHPGLLAFMEKI